MKLLQVSARYSVVRSQLEENLIHFSHVQIMRGVIVIALVATVILTCLLFDLSAAQIGK